MTTLSYKGYDIRPAYGWMPSMPKSKCARKQVCERARAWCLSQTMARFQRRSIAFNPQTNVVPVVQINPVPEFGTLVLVPLSGRAAR